MIPTIFLLCLFFGGANAAFVKYAGSKISPIDLVFFRSVIAALALAPFVEKKELIKFKNNPKILPVAALLFAANWILFAYGIQMTSIAMGSLIYVPTPLVVALLGYFLLREKLAKKEIAGLVLSMIGITYLIMRSFESRDLLSLGTPMGNFLVILGLASWSLYIVLTRKISTSFKPLTIIFIDFLLSGFVAFFFFIFNLKHFSSDIFDQSLVFSILGLAFLSSIVFFFLNQWVVKKSSAFISSMLIYPVTFSGIIYGMILFKEKLEISIVTGGIVLLLGVLLSISKYIRA